MNSVKKPMVFSIKNVLLYAFGGLFIALGVVLMIMSNLGTSSWDSLHFSLSNMFGFSIGAATIIVAMVFTVIVIILNKSFKYLLMAIPIFYVGALIDLIGLEILSAYAPTLFITRVASFLSGVILLPLGGSMLIISTFPAGIFDEFNLSMMKLFHTDKLATIRVIMELLAVLTAFIIGISSKDKIDNYPFGMINYGTLIFSVSVGTILKTYLKLFERIGLYEN